MRFVKKMMALLLRRLFGFLGYTIQINSNRRISDGTINLNVGAGSRPIPNFISLDKYSPYYYPSREKFEKTRVSFDIRKDQLPFEKNEVSNIYVSHVLEHIEDEFIVKFLEDAARVLKPNAVLRIACPDAEFLHTVSSFENDYWSWRKDWADNPKYSTCGSTYYSQWDYFLAETLGSRMKYARNRDDCEEIGLDTLSGNFVSVVDRYGGQKYRDEFPSDHINFIFFKKLEKFGKTAGFSQVVNSKFQGSVSPAMRGHFFDQKAPQMTLYVDFVK